MTSNNLSLRFRLASNTNENADAPQPEFKPATDTTTSSDPNRALSDITNLSHRRQRTGASFKNARVRPETSSKVIKPVPTISKRRLAKRPRTSAPLTPIGKSEDLALQFCEAAKSALHSVDPPIPVSSDPVQCLFDTVRLPQGVIDIDACDAGDHLANSVYAKDAYRSLLVLEQRHIIDPGYMLRQPYLTAKMRSILVDWLVDVHQRFGHLPETLHLAIHVLDRFLEQQLVSRRKLQLVGITCLFIAAKYEEMYLPEVDDFVAITDKSYTTEEIFHMERVILNRLRFELRMPSASTFLPRILKAVGEETGCDTERLENTAQFLIELALQDYEMLKYRPSLRAAAATMLAAKILGMPVAWSRSMEFHSGGWATDNLKVCEAELGRIVDHEQDIESRNRLTALKRKFRAVRFGLLPEESVLRF